MSEPAVSGGSLIDEIVRDGARRMLAAAWEAEVAAYIAAHTGELDENGHRPVVRNGRARPRQVLTSSGAVEVVAPRVNHKRVDEQGERRRFASAVLPARCRESPQINEVLPLLYLHGLSSQDFVPALQQFLGTSSGLSAATVTRLTVQWQEEARAFAARDLSGVDYLHKNANVLGALPKSAHPGAKKAVAEIWNAEDRDNARRAVAAFKLAYGGKFAKAVAKVVDDLDELLAFYDFPAEHWVHLRTTNPIESTFATVRHRTKVTKGPGSKAAGLAMAFKLIEAAQQRWRAVNAPHLVALVRAGAEFTGGRLIERPAHAA
ncbi:transposase [Actinoplanes philippinensis]|uniref:transposase n=1 Tax=Actinoplanes philippinensis TaxID=35752 RepID=UPI0033EA9C57